MGNKEHAKVYLDRAGENPIPGCKLDCLNEIERCRKEFYPDKVSRIKSGRHNWNFKK